MEAQTAYLRRIDFRMPPILLAIMGVSLATITSYTSTEDQSSFLSPLAQRQLQFFIVGWLVYFAAAILDYRKLREWTWILYGFGLLTLIGLFFVPAVHNVHRWYRLPGVPFDIQPSEQAKLLVVIALAWFLERRQAAVHKWSTVFGAGAIVGVPFLLILKEPDLGTALTLFPVTLVLFYLSDVKPLVVKLMGWGGLLALALTLTIFLGVIDHEAARPYATKFLKEYQYARLNPDTPHQKASLTAIGVGGVWGQGWQQGEFAGRGWLPYAHTDSIFPAFAEEFGLVGCLILLSLFYSIVYFGFRVSMTAKDTFGRLVAAGISTYIAMQIIVNVGMMLSFFPITGFPLILMTYGGSSIVSTMSALGVLQSIYSRRFMF